MSNVVSLRLWFWKLYRAHYIEPSLVYYSILSQIGYFSSTIHIFRWGRFSFIHSKISTSIRYLYSYVNKELQITIMKCEILMYHKNFSTSTNIPISILAFLSNYNTVWNATLWIILNEEESIQCHRKIVRDVMRCFAESKKEILESQKWLKPRKTQKNYQISIANLYQFT